MEQFVRLNWFLIISTCLISVTSVNCDVDVITRLCRFEGCYDLKENEPKYSGVEYNRKLLNFFGSGISELIYEEVRSLDSSLNGSLSSSCSDHLAIVSQALDQGREWAFRLVDSSGKTPPAFLEGTVTSLGDYDECLGISAPDSDIAGQYCMVDVFPKAYEGDSKNVASSGQVSLATPRHFNASAYYFGLCFPSACSKSDVRILVKKVLEPFPLLVEGDLHCDTAESISFKSHLANMRIGTFISLIFLLTLVSAVAWGSLAHAFYRDKATVVQMSFSAFENVHKLFYVPPSTASSRTDYIDWYRMLSICAGVGSHIMCCLESPIGFFMLSHHKNLEKMISDPTLIPLFNEASMVGMTFVSGAAFFMAAYPVARSGRLPFLPALVDRLMRHLPGLSAIVALDFTWYLWGSGPFYSRVGQFQVDKCSKTWWKNFLFVSNLWGPSIEICAGHTYFLSVDVQLFVLGFVAIALLASRPKLGVAYCATMIASSMSLLYYYGARHKLTPTLMTPRNPAIHNLEQFLIYVHMSTSGFVPSYFWAILLCYAISLGWWRRFGANLNHYVWIGLILGLNEFHMNLPIITNYVDWLSTEWTPFYIVFVRFGVIIQMSAFIIYVALLETKATEAKKAAQFAANISPLAPQKPSEGYYSLGKGIMRLSFAIYLSNYYYIRTNFYTERTLYYNTFYAFIKRFCASFPFILVSAFAFQIIVLGPFTNLRIALLSKKSSAKKEK